MISLNQIDLGNGLYEIKLDGLRLVMRKSDGYVNASKLCKDAGKLFHDWSRLKSSEEFLDEFRSTGIPLDPTEQISTGPNDERGTYVHPDIAIQVANWCSPKFAVQVSSIVRRFYTGDLFLIQEVAQNYNATHETKVLRVEVTISEEKKLELKERELALIERTIALLDVNEPREKIAAQSLKINAVNYLQRSLGNSIEETKAPQELPALQIIINQLVRIESKGLKSSVKLALEHFTLLVSKKIAQRYRELHHENPKQKLYVNDRGIEIVCNLYTTEDEQMIRETILNYVSEYNLRNKFGIVISKITNNTLVRMSLH